MVVLGEPHETFWDNYIGMMVSIDLLSRIKPGVFHVSRFETKIFAMDYKNIDKPIFSTRGRPGEMDLFNPKRFLDSYDILRRPSTPILMQ